MRTKITSSIGYFTRIIKILSSAGPMYLVGVILLAIVFGIFPGISILFMQQIVNSLQTGMGDRLFLLIGGYILLDVLSSGLGLLSGYIESKLQMKAGITLNMTLLEKVQDLTLKDFENANTYDLIQRAKGVGIGQMFGFFKSFITVFQSLITLVMFSAILFTFRWWLVPLVFVMPGLSTYVAAFFGKQQFLIQKNRAGEDRRRWYFQYLLTNDIAFKEIKVFDIGGYFRERYLDISRKFLVQDRELLNRRTLASLGLMVLDQLVSGGMFVFIILRTFAGEILLGDMITFTRSISNVKGSTQGLLGQINGIYQSSLYISQYFEFLDMPVADMPVSEVPLAAPAGGDIHGDIQTVTIRNLTYSYNGQPALQGIDLTLHKGQLTAFIGQNGSGKTTLTKILSTLYTDYGGQVLWDHTDLRHIPHAKDKIGILFQDFVKYELSLAENVSLGANTDSPSEITDENVLANVLAVLAKTGITHLPPDTQLGHWFEKGQQLSGGQWLKIALARAFIRDASLYILDEPNAALDPVSERQILKAFKTLCNDKIGVLISHRISSIKDVADNIVVFDQGRVVSSGTHAQLASRCPVYQELLASELGEDV